MLIHDRLLRVAEPAARASASLADGFLNAAAWLAARQSAGVFVLGLGRPGAERKRGAEIVFFGTGAADATGSYRVLAANALALGPGNTKDAPGDVLLSLVAFGGFTLGTQAGAAGSVVLAAERFADTVTVTATSASTTPKGAGAARTAAFGGLDPSAYSPADNTVARLFIPELGAADELVVEVFAPSAGTAGALVRGVV